MAFTYHVLCFGHILMLLETRQWILEKCFLSVYVSSLSDLKRVAEGGGFDLLILCHYLSRHDFRKAADPVHDICPRLKLFGRSSDMTVWALCFPIGSWPEWMDLVFCFKWHKRCLTLTEATHLHRQLILLLRPCNSVCTRDSLRFILVGQTSSSFSWNEGSMCAQVHFRTSYFGIWTQAR
jgi:hypothetical protein